MNFRRCILAGVTGAVLLLPAAASAWRALNRHEVLPVSQGVWEVVSRVGSGPQDYWCGIGDFAVRQLRAPVNQRIYVWKGVGPSVNRPGRKAVQFAFGAPPGADTSSRLSLNIREPGDNLMVSSAQKYCYDFLPGKDPLRW
ncbi:hypothetical protein [Leisingera sp. ANG-Vp]|uniref:hypothetical protein n=1 Tax=Leisingera sp. ANG-Vp TaxID=1577896 RepID=UPI00057F9388|nr:hypothetical protein [Leisingera sp. ANG-Vp]KIC13803.1 hypothetical protein RA20_22260 [Leisingera sp. ANG-Vp]